jgi:hypothetical protein
MVLLKTLFLEREDYLYSENLRSLSGDGPSHALPGKPEFSDSTRGSSGGLFFFYVQAHNFS